MRLDLEQAYDHKTRSFAPKFTRQPEFSSKKETEKYSHFLSKVLPRCSQVTTYQSFDHTGDQE